MKSAAWLALVAGCTAPHTQIVLVIDTDLTGPQALDAVQLDVTGPTASFQRDGGVGQPGTPSFPLTYALREDPVSTGPVTVTVRGFAHGLERVRATVRATFVAGQTVTLPVALVSVCTRQTCDDDPATTQSCSPAGVCADIDADPLPAWTGTPPRYDAGADDPVGELALGSTFACVVRATSGAVDCWGDDTRGQLGDGTQSSRPMPRAVTGPGPTVSVVAGDAHACALQRDGTVACWGDDSSGQLGDGVTGHAGCTPPATTSDCSTHPVTVTGLTDAVELAAGSAHTCARRADGTVACWGGNASGQCGNGAMGGTCAAPTPVTGLVDAVQISLGGSSACALRANGQVVCWGSNNRGQLGDGTTTSRATPVAVAATTARWIGVGLQHACAIVEGGAVVCWGWNASGQLGIDAATGMQLQPGAHVPSVSGALEVVGATNHTCARLADGTARCWGGNGAGQLGNGGTNSSATPTAVSMLTDASRLRTRAFFTCAESGTPRAVSCWGANDAGELGPNASHGTMPSPTVVPIP